LWDSINNLRSADSLVWGFSESDAHGIYQIFMNYNHHYITTLTEGALRENLIAGAFTFSYEPSGTGVASTPILTNVDISGLTIKLTVNLCDSIRWVDKNGEWIITGDSINTENYETHFVRAVLYNDNGVTYTQPFGIKLLTESIATDITSFSLAAQTGAATINATNHTVIIEVAYSTDVTNLAPSITLSYGATISPTSLTARDFTNPVSYTVTAEDETTTQEWTVTVTVDETPVPVNNAVVSGNKWVIYNGRIVTIE